MSRRANPRLVGAFVLLALALAVLAVVLFGSGRLFREQVTLVSYFDGSVAGLNRGALVRFRGVEVGTVKDIRLQLAGQDLALAGFAIPVVWDLDVDRLRSRGDVERDYTNRAVLDSLVDEGLRARLGVESLVTGRLFIALDIYADRPAGFSGGADIPYPEVPTLPTEFEEIQAQLEKVVAVLARIEVEDFVAAVTGTVEGIKNFVGSDQLNDAIGSLSGTVDELSETLVDARALMATVDTTMLPLRRSFTATADSASATLHELQETLKTVRTVMEPGSPLTFQLERTLSDLAGAARSLRALTEFLERNPSALLRGKPEGGP